MASICGTDCGSCGFKEKCNGCSETCGRPFGGACVAANCWKNGGEDEFIRFERQTVEEFNALGISDMPQITGLNKLCGWYVNLEYPLPNGQKIKLLDDSKIYIGCQVEKTDKSSDKCYGLVADEDYLLVCEYGCNGSDPQIVLYKKR